MLISCGFSKDKGFSPVSWIIRKVLDTDYSHTYIHFLKNKTVFEATWLSGVKVVPYSKWLRVNVPVLEVKIPISQERYEILKQFVIDNEGKRYGYLSIIRILIKRVSGGLNHFAPDNFICSELVGLALADILGLSDSDISLLDPYHIYILVQNLPLILGELK